MGTGFFFRDCYARAGCGKKLKRGIGKVSTHILGKKLIEQANLIEPISFGQSVKPDAFDYLVETIKFC